MRKSKPENVTKACSVRLFKVDIATLERLADKNGTTWQIELRLLVRRALRRVVIKD